MKRLFFILTFVILSIILIACTDNRGVSTSMQGTTTAPRMTSPISTESLDTTLSPLLSSTITTVAIPVQTSSPTTTSATTTSATTTSAITTCAVTTAPPVTDELETGAAYVIKRSNGYSMGGSSFGSIEGEVVKFAKYRGDLDEFWRLIKLDDGSYNLINAASGFYLSKNPRLQDSSALSLEKKNEKFLQSWQITKGNNGYLISLAGEDKYLSSNFETGPCDLVLRDGDDSAQLWELHKVFDKDEELPSILTLSGATEAPASCPEIFKYGDTYYNINMTAGMLVKRSTDLVHWEVCNWVFDGVPSWITEKLGPSASIWAPGFYMIGDRLCIYYCASTLGSQRSLIGLVYADSPTGPYTDMGMVIESRPGEPYNCIDPNIVLDDDGTPYLVFGSFWGGTYMRKIDSETGFLDKSAPNPWHLAMGINDMEAPYLVKRGDYYYLFVARGILGKNGSYHWAVGRSESLFGPFYDRDGEPMLRGNTTDLTENKSNIEGVAHAQPFLDSDGQWYMVGEAWPDDTNVGNNIFLHISKIVWTDDGWPVTALSPDIISDLSGYTHERE